MLRAPRRCASPRATGPGVLSWSDVNGGCPQATAGYSATRQAGTRLAIATRAGAQRTRRRTNRANPVQWACRLRDRCRDGSLELCARAPNDLPIWHRGCDRLPSGRLDTRPWRSYVLACSPLSGMGGQDTPEVPSHITVGRGPLRAVDVAVLPRLAGEPRGLSVAEPARQAHRPRGRRRHAPENMCFHSRLPEDYGAPRNLAMSPVVSALQRRRRPLRTAMKEGLLDGKLRSSSRANREEARLHVARWIGSESQEA